MNARILALFWQLIEVPFSRIATDAMEFTTLQTGLYTPIEIMQQYGLEAIGSKTGEGRGDVRDFSKNHFNVARQLIGCAHCSEDKLFQVLKEVQTGSNTYGLNKGQQTEYIKSITRAYNSSSYYRSLKQDYRKGQIVGKVGDVINAVVQYYSGGVVSFGLDYRGDRLYGDPNKLIIPGDCAEPPCNGRSQNSFAKVFKLGGFGGKDILRVDTAANTLQVNDGKKIEGSIYDIAGDGKEEAQEYLEVSEGGTSVMMCPQKNGAFFMRFYSLDFRSVPELCNQ